MPRLPFVKTSRNQRIHEGDRIRREGGRSTGPTVVGTVTRVLNEGPYVDELVVWPDTGLLLRPDEIHDVVVGDRRRKEAGSQIQQAMWQKAHKNTKRLRRSTDPAEKLAGVARTIGPPISPSKRSEVVHNSVAALFDGPQMQDLSSKMSGLSVRDDTYATYPPWPSSRSRDDIYETELSNKMHGLRIRDDT